jgi:nitroreductase
MMDMTRREFAAATLGSGLPAMAAGADPQPRALPPPRREGGMPLMNALKLRHSTREYSNRAVSDQMLSSLLWASFGINRVGGDRTAPYWRHIMVIDVYVATADGVWVYQPAANALARYLPDDIRVHTGLQEFVASAALNLIYVAHGERMTDISAAERQLYASVDSAFIGQNVYLFCASEGLATVFRGAIDYPTLTRALKLPTGQFVTFAQTVGYPHETS